MQGNEGHKCEKVKEHPYYSKKCKDLLQRPFMDGSKETIGSDGRIPFLMQIAEAAGT